MYRKARRTISITVKGATFEVDAKKAALLKEHDQTVSILVPGFVPIDSDIHLPSVRAETSSPTVSMEVRRPSSLVDNFEQSWEVGELKEYMYALWTEAVAKSKAESEGKEQGIHPNIFCDFAASPGSNCLISTRKWFKKLKEDRKGQSVINAADFMREYVPLVIKAFIIRRRSVVPLQNDFVMKMLEKAIAKPDLWPCAQQHCTEGEMFRFYEAKTDDKLTAAMQTNPDPFKQQSMVEIVSEAKSTDPLVTGICLAATGYLVLAHMIPYTAILSVYAAGNPTALTLIAANSLWWHVHDYILQPMYVAVAARYGSRRTKLLMRSFADKVHEKIPKLSMNPLNSIWEADASPGIMGWLRSKLFKKGDGQKYAKLFKKGVKVVFREVGNSGEQRSIESENDVDAAASFWTIQSTQAKCERMEVTNESRKETRQLSYADVMPYELSYEARVAESFNGRSGGDGAEAAKTEAEAANTLDLCPIYKTSEIAASKCDFDRFPGERFWCYNQGNCFPMQLVLKDAGEDPNKIKCPDPYKFTKTVMRNTYYVFGSITTVMTSAVWTPIVVLGAHTAIHMAGHIVAGVGAGAAKLGLGWAATHLLAVLGLAGVWSSICTGTAWLVAIVAGGFTAFFGMLHSGAAAVAFALSSVCPWCGVILGVLAVIFMGTVFYLLWRNKKKELAAKRESRDGNGLIRKFPNVSQEVSKSVTVWSWSWSHYIYANV